MAHICEVLHGLKPLVVMIFVQIAYTIMNILYKLVANDGMNLRIFIAYRLMFATAFVGPIALIFERKSRPKLTWMILFQAFLSGLFGGLLAQNLYIECLALTSATFATSMSNLIPAITFIFAICFRMEKLGIGAKGGKAKVLGTVMGIGGAMVLTFYKGAEIQIWSTHVNLLHNNHSHHHQTNPKLNNHFLGSLSSLGGSFSFAIWLVIQGKMSKRYPCHYSSTALMCLMGSIQCVVFALCMERQWNQWKLTWNIRLFTAAYSGIVTSGIVVTLITWCLAIRGPVFVCNFGPLSSLLVTIASSLFLDENLHCGTIIGGALIVCGLYMVLWGKSKEIKVETQLLLPPSKTKSCQQSDHELAVSAAQPNTTHLQLNFKPSNSSIDIAGESLEKV